MDEVKITALFVPKRTKIYNCIAAFEVFNFNGEIANDNNPIVTQEFIADLRNQFEEDTETMREEAFRRQRGLPGTIDFDLWMKRIAMGGLALVCLGGVVGIVCVGYLYGAAILAYLGA